METIARLTVPLDFNAGEEVHATEAQGMGGYQGYVHLLRDPKSHSKNRIQT